MLDSGSTLSFMTQKIATALKTQRTTCVTEITGLSSTPTATSRYKSDVHLKTPLESPESSINITTYRQTRTQDLSNHREASFASKLQLADHDFGLPGQIDLLLGQDVIPGEGPSGPQGQISMHLAG